MAAFVKLWNGFCAVGAQTPFSSTIRADNDTRYMYFLPKKRNLYMN
jgi:hypothetical protein